MDAFDLAERLQTPVFVMSDLDLGMNTWMSDPFEYPTKPLDRGKVLDAETLARIGDWGRYKDVDGDGIPYRTLPGTGMPAYFTRGTGHNEKARYSERPDDFVHNLDRLTRKFDTAREHVPGAGRRRRPAPRSASSPTARRTGRSRRAAISWCARPGSRPTTSACAPFRSTTRSASSSTRHDRVYVVEQNRDAQMLGLLQAGAERRSHRQAAQGAALQRPAARRAIGDRPTSWRRKGRSPAVRADEREAAGALGGE